MKTNLSSCCNAEVKEDYSRDGKHWYYCSGCMKIAPNLEEITGTGKYIKIQNAVGNLSVVGYCDLASPELVANNSENSDSKLTANLKLCTKVEKETFLNKSKVASTEVIEKWDLVLAFKDRMITLNAGDILTKDTIKEIGEYLSTQEKELEEILLRNKSLPRDDYQKGWNECIEWMLSIINEDTK